MKIIFCGVAVFLLLSVSAEAEFLPIPFGPGANASLRDDQAEDRQGGFIDLGGNDLRFLPSGLQTFLGIPFKLGSSSTSADKACLVLGGPQRAYLPQKAEVKLGKPARGAFLYLFHGTAFVQPAKAQPVVGTVTIVYTDGKPESRHIRFGRDVGEWTSPKSYANALRAWTVYNSNTQVSLFIAAIPLQADKDVSTIRFEAGQGTWMVIGVTLGDQRKLRPILPDMKLSRTYAAPPAFAKPLPVYPAGEKPKNIILVLGDGMGSGALALAADDVYHKEGGLGFEQLPFAGLCTTFSANADVTDSAAAGTAFSTGHKTNNSRLGLDSEKGRLTSIAAIAREAGMAVGLLTDDSFVGATPSAFYAHTLSRNDAAAITLDASQCGYDILLGYGCKNWFLPQAKGGWREDNKPLLSDMTADGYFLVESLDAFLTAPKDKRILGFLTPGALKDEPCYEPLMKAAIDRLAQNPKGFFMMLESCDPDHGGHANKPEVSVSGTIKADWAVHAAVGYSLAHDGDTLVLVTADHETGGIVATLSHGTGKVTVKYETTSHTGNPVPMHAFGRGAELFEGLIDNTDIPKNFAKLLGLSLR